MNQRFLIVFILAIAAVGGGIYLVFSSTKGAHLQLDGKILKVRTGALDESTSAAVIDFRIQNPTDVQFVIRDLTVTLQKADGTMATGTSIAKTDLKMLLTYNKFLGAQYNDALSLHDKIGPRSTVDRMVAVRFEEPLKTLETAKSLKLYMQDVDGTEWETTHQF